MIVAYFAYVKFVECTLILILATEYFTQVQALLIRNCKFVIISKYFTIVFLILLLSFAVSGMKMMKSNISFLWPGCSIQDIDHRHHFLDGHRWTMLKQGSFNPQLLPTLSVPKNHRKRRICLSNPLKTHLVVGHSYFVSLASLKVEMVVISVHNICDLFEGR